MQTQWNLQEIKQLKKKKLVQSNLVMLVLFLLIVSFSKFLNLVVMIGIFCVFVWIYVARILYTLKTGKPIGTKTMKQVYEFDRNHFGEKRWKRLKVSEAIMLIGVSVLLLVLFFGMDFNSDGLGLPFIIFPFIGAWIGSNIGEIFRMNNL